MLQLHVCAQFKGYSYLYKCTYMHRDVCVLSSKVKLKKKKKYNI